MPQKEGALSSAQLSSVRRCLMAFVGQDSNLKTHKPPPGVKWFQQLNENHGVRKVSVSVLGGHWHGKAVHQRTRIAG
jgi:hypothetical protein